MELTVTFDHTADAIAQSLLVNGKYMTVDVDSSHYSILTNTIINEWQQNATRHTIDALIDVTCKYVTTPELANLAVITGFIFAATTPAFVRDMTTLMMMHHIRMMTKSGIGDVNIAVSQIIESIGESYIKDCTDPIKTAVGKLVVFGMAFYTIVKAKELTSTINGD